MVSSALFTVYKNSNNKKKLQYRALYPFFPSLVSKNLIVVLLCILQYSFYGSLSLLVFLIITSRELLDELFSTVFHHQTQDKQLKDSPHVFSIYILKLIYCKRIDKGFKIHSEDHLFYATTLNGLPTMQLHRSSMR